MNTKELLTVIREYLNEVKVNSNIRIEDIVKNIYSGEKEEIVKSKVDSTICMLGRVEDEQVDEEEKQASYIRRLTTILSFLSQSTNRLNKSSKKKELK